jgi:LacI family transcriptional regulator
VAPATRETVLRVASELGYEPNRMARGLRRARTRMIGMLIPDTRGASFSAEASQILHRRLKEHGYGLMLCAYHHDREIEKEYIETLPKLGIAGLFHKPLGVGSAESLMQGEDHIHVVELVRASGSSKLDAVIYDEAHGSEQSVEHLLQLGHRCIGLVVGPPRLGSTRQRIDGALRAVDKRRLDRSTLVIRHAEHTVDGGGRALRMLLEGNRTITGVYAAGEQLALGAALGAVAAGVRIPADISLVGLGHPSWGDLMRPRLTSYTLPLEELAMTAALLMVSRVVKEQTRSAEPVRITLAGRMNVQQSTAPPASLR